MFQSLSNHPTRYILYLVAQDGLYYKVFHCNCSVMKFYNSNNQSIIYYNKIQ